MNATLPLALATAALLCAGTASALEPACETYLRAAEKTARQPTRHMITEVEGMRMELIVVGGQAYSRVDGGKWQAHKRGADPITMERKMVAAIRAGEYPLTGCRKVGSETIEGIRTTVYAYTLAIPGLPAGEARAYIGADGLVHGQKSDDAVVRHRYTGVTAPKP